MATHNANNERIQPRYFTYLKEAMRYSEASVDGAAKALSRFEEVTRYRQVESSRQGKIIRNLADPRLLMRPHVDGLAKALVREMRVTVSKPPGE